MLKRALFLLICCVSMTSIKPRFVDDAIVFEIIIPSRNNAKWCLQNLQSAVLQDYPHFHITYIDDCSDDDTGRLVDEFVAMYRLHDFVTVIHNTERRGAMANWYYAITACPDHTVIVNLDGDDMLAHTRVLSKLADVYKNYDVWITYGQFIEWPRHGKGWCKAMPDDVVAENSYRSYVHMPSHLRTYYAWLFKKINPADLLHEGAFFTMTCDQAMMFPMIEMAGERHAFIEDILYLYNTTNTASDHVADGGTFQSSISNIIRAKTPYSRLSEPAVPLKTGKPLYPRNPIPEKKY